MVKNNKGVLFCFALGDAAKTRRKAETAKGRHAVTRLLVARAY